MANGYSPGVEVTEYKGHPVLNLPMGNGGRYSFSFGLSKAKTVLAYLEDVRKFVEANDRKED